MTAAVSTAPADGGALVANIMHFARVLRAAGLPIGPGKVLDAIRAVRVVGLSNRPDFYWCLHAVFVNRRDQRELFDQAFHVFWRNPQILERMMALVLPSMRQADDAERARVSRRLADALNAGQAPQTRETTEPETPDFDMAMTWSDRDVLRHMDFETMSAAEFSRAKAAIAAMRLPQMDVPTRRFRPDPAGRRIDMRATLRAALRSGGNIPLRRRARRQRRPPLVILCDISGSMSQYSRMLLHFMHVASNDRDRVHAFLFGTRLTNITRYLRHRDVDLALEKIGEAAPDWSGGTRIGHALDSFNRFWSRRVLGQGAVVLLISDGLERDATDLLERAMERLHKSCRRLIWLNPLLRYEGFAPRAQGARAMLPHVDDFRPVHNLESLEQLTAALGRPTARREERVSRWLPSVASP